MALCRFLDVAQRGLAPATLRAVRADARVFAAWCGASELVALRWADLHPDDPDDPEARPGEGTIRIRRSKTDPEGEGAEVWLSAEAMAALAAWRVVAPRWPDSVTGAADPLAVGFSGHSLRVGAAQDLFAAGIERLRTVRGAVARIRRSRQGGDQGQDPL